MKTDYVYGVLYGCTFTSEKDIDLFTTKEAAINNFWKQVQDMHEGSNRLSKEVWNNIQEAIKNATPLDIDDVFSLYVDDDGFHTARFISCDDEDVYKEFSVVQREVKVR